MTDPAVLEARDPATSPERLLDLLMTVADWNMLHPGQPSVLAPVEQAVLTNPSLSLSLLSTFVSLPPSHPWPRLVWFNPAISLLLADSRPRLEESARLLLAHLGDTPHTTASLDTLVRAWGHRDPSSHGETSVRALAHRLAQLFGVPWSEPAVSSPARRQLRMEMRKALAR